MRPIFQEALSCATGAHCHRCRQVESGREFRASIVALFQSLGEVDFPCPNGHPWDHSPAVQTVQGIVQKVISEPGQTEAMKWLKCMASQIGQLVKENRGRTCQEKTRYRMRLEAKLRFYIGKYGPPALALQFPFNPAAIQPCGCPGGLPGPSRPADRQS